MSTVPAALASINTLLQRGNGGSPQSFTTVANVSSINGFSLKAKSEEVTSHSTGVPWRQKIPTLLDAGSIKAKVFYVPSSAGHKQLLDDMANRRILDYKMVWPDVPGTFWQCAGFITDFSASAPVDGVASADVTWELTGDPILPTA